MTRVEIRLVISAPAHTDHEEELRLDTFVPSPCYLLATMFTSRVQEREYRFTGWKSAMNFERGRQRPFLRPARQQTSPEYNDIQFMRMIGLVELLVDLVTSFSHPTLARRFLYHRWSKGRRASGICAYNTVKDRQCRIR